MSDSSLKTWQRAVAYGAFGLFALFIAFFLTFPYDALEDRIKGEADAAGYFVRIGSLGPGLFSVRATDILISKKVAPTTGDAPPPEPMRIDSLSIGPTLLPPGLSVTAKLLGGAASAKISGLSSLGVHIELEKLDVSKGNLKGFTGIDMAGEIDGDITLAVPKARRSCGGLAEPDFGQANGTFSLETKNSDGERRHDEPDAADVRARPDAARPAEDCLPGDIVAKLSFDKGSGKIDDFLGQEHRPRAGGERHAEAVEEDRLLRAEHRAALQGRARLRETARAHRQRGCRWSAPDPKDPNFRMGHLTGYLGKPNFR